MITNNSDFKKKKSKCIYMLITVACKKQRNPVCQLYGHSDKAKLQKGEQSINNFLRTQGALGKLLFPFSGRRGWPPSWFNLLS